MKKRMVWNRKSKIILTGFLGTFILILVGCTQKDSPISVSASEEMAKEQPMSIEAVQANDLINEMTVVPLEGEFYDKINNNPIDAEFTWEQEGTEERIQAACRYCDLWTLEIENTLNILEEYLDKEDYDRLCASYEGWKQYLENTTEVERALFYIGSSYMETSEIAGASLTYPRVMEIKAVRTRNYAIELKSLEYAFTGDVEFVYVSQPSADNSTASEQKSDYQWFIEPGVYEDIKLLDENLIAVKDSSGKYGFIDGEMKPITECRYFNVLGVGEEIARVMDFEHQFLFVDYQGNPICKETFQDANNFSEGLAAVKSGDKWGFIDKEGTLVIDCQYDNVNEGFKEGVVPVEKNGTWIFIDQSGSSVFKEAYEAALPFSEGLAAVKQDDKWGFIDHSGEPVIEYQYDEAGNFSEGKASVMKVIDGYKMWAYIDTENEIVLDYKLYSSSEGRIEVVGEFQDGYALVTDELYCLINEQGDVVLGNASSFLTAGSVCDPLTGYLIAYDYVDDAMMEEKYGVINIDGEVIVPFVFEHISDIEGNLAVVKCKQGNDLETGVIWMAQSVLTPTAMPTSSPLATPVPKGDILERSYGSRNDFPHENMEFVDEKTYIALKEIYDEIDFWGEYEKGNLEVYDTYIEEYRKLVQNEVTFTIPDTGEKCYLKDYVDVEGYYLPVEGGSNPEDFDPHAFIYYLFDMNGDGTPELCVWRSLTYIFRYDYDTEEMVLWKAINTPWEKVLGTRKLWWNWQGTQYTLCELDEDGAVSMGVYFLVDCWNEETILYLLTIPKYAEKEHQITITQEMKEQAYFSEQDQLYMFRVTEEQFYELTGDFFEAGKLSAEKIKEVSFTYDELFGNNELCESCVKLRDYINAGRVVGG